MKLKLKLNLEEALSFAVFLLVLGSLLGTLYLVESFKGCTLCEQGGPCCGFSLDNNKTTDIIN